MAEGFDPTKPLIDGDDEDEDAGPSNVFVHADLTGGDEAHELHKFTSTSSRRGSAADTSNPKHAENPFIGGQLRERESEKGEVMDELKRKYPKFNPTKVIARFDEYRRLFVRLVKGKSAEFPILPDGTVGKSAKKTNPSETLLAALGPTAEETVTANDETVANNDETIANKNARIRELEAEARNADEAQKNTLNQRIEQLQGREIG